MLVTPSEMTTFFIAWQADENTDDILLVQIHCGIVTLVKLLQPSNARTPMFVTESGIVTLVSPLQPENAEDPMIVTESGIVTPVSPLQP